MQDQNIESLLIGIISGILTTVIIYVVVLFLKKIVLPWYQELIYRGLDINGEWREKLTLANELIQESIINLRQKGHKVTGTVTLIKKFPERADSEIKTFNITGSFYDRILSASCKTIDRKQIGCYNIILEVVSGGEEMIGITAWYDVGANRILSDKIKWTRTK